MQSTPQRILVTGAAGFIGAHLTRALVAAGHTVTGIDNFSDYYDVSLKRARVATLCPDVPIIEADISDESAIEAVFSAHTFDVVCHLAASAGVRYSTDHPMEVIHNNVDATVVILEAMRRHRVTQMVFASTSSVYGNDTEAPFTEAAVAAQPVSIYGMSKRAAELLLYTYYELHGIQSTSFRFFTVYGPWSRPDMAMLKFAERMVRGEPIDLYNRGELSRDFTYVADIVAGFMAAVYKPLGYEIINLGNGSPVPLLEYVAALETALGRTAKRRLLPMQPGDVYTTYADISKAQTLLGYQPKTTLAEGVTAFAEWFTGYNPTLMNV